MSVENFLSHIAERFFGGGGKPSALCFRFFLAAKKVWKRREGGIKIFCRNFFVSQYRKTPGSVCLPVPKNRSVFQKKSCLENFHA